MADQGVMYVEATSAFADADFGKVSKGRILALSEERAIRFKTLGLAKDSTESAFTDYRDNRPGRIDERGRRADFDQLERQAAGDDWDTSTTRDVTMAPEAGIRRAFAQGRLVNTDMLRDEDGNVLPQDASLEQILEARNNLAFQESPLTAHERSSVQGGGPHTGVPQTFDLLDGVAPLNASSQKLSPEQLGNGRESDEPAKRGGRRKADAPDEGAKGKSGI